jgi:hypothetical protein
MRYLKALVPRVAAQHCLFKLLQDYKQPWKYFISTFVKITSYYKQASLEVKVAGISHQLRQRSKVWRANPCRRVPPLRSSKPVRPTELVATQQHVVKCRGILVDKGVEKTKRGLSGGELNVVEPSKNCSDDGCRGRRAAERKELTWYFFIND